MKRVLVPLDGSKDAEVALPFLGGILDKDDVVALLWVGKPEAPQRVGALPGKPARGGFSGPSGGVIGVATPDVSVFAETKDQTSERQIAEARDYLETLAETLRQAGIWVSTHALLDEHPADAVVEFARNMKPTFIAMLRRTKFGVGERLFGSAATRVIESEVAPVLFVPAPRG
jgi:nucleotide-binding universal stress UspA family protein